VRVLFDGFWWLAGPVSNRQVMQQFVLAWEDQFPQDQLAVAVPHADVAAVRGQLPKRVRIVATRLRPQGVSAIVELPFLARRIRADVIVTHNFTPAFGSSAVFVHDFMFVSSPEWFTATERAYFALMPLTIRRARWVLTSSASESERISRLAPGRPDVTPVGLGLSPGLAAAVPRRPEGVPDTFLLAVGRLNARKNLAGAIAGGIASGVVSPEVPLLVVGEAQGRRADLGPGASDAVASGAVRFLGFIDDDELAWLYSNARVFLFLSLDEGFGMPTLEAARFGAPVVASDIPVFREILGDRAKYVRPDAVSETATAIAEAFASGRLAPVDPEELGYSWRLSAQRIRAAIAGPTETRHNADSTPSDSR
jgi:glycosyltransferase involved in cell wall biosynthesis